MRNTRAHRSGKLGWLPVGLATLALLLTVGCQSAAPAKPAATAAATTAPPPPAGGDPARGQQVFTSTCNACHPGGQQGVGPSMVGVSGRLSDAQITQVVRQGRGGMPASAGLTDQQVTDLLAYLRTLR